MQVIKIIIALILLSLIVTAHSGRTDKYGGHHNRKTGGYHYHNAGTMHDPNNPYQDHTKCGICPGSMKSDTGEIDIKPEELVIALQAGLKCMGYKISNIDGKFGPETKIAIKKYIEEHK